MSEDLKVTLLAHKYLERIIGVGPAAELREKVTKGLAFRGVVGLWTDEYVPLYNPGLLSNVLQHYADTLLREFDLSEWVTFTSRLSSQTIINSWRNFPDFMVPAVYSVHNQPTYYNVRVEKEFDLSPGGVSLLSQLMNNAFIEEHVKPEVTRTSFLHHLDNVFGNVIHKNWLRDWFDLGLTSDRISGRLPGGLRLWKCGGGEHHPARGPQSVKGLVKIGPRLIPFQISHSLLPLGQVIAGAVPASMELSLEGILNPYLTKAGLDVCEVTFDPDFGLDVSPGEFRARHGIPYKE